MISPQRRDIAARTAQQRAADHQSVSLYTPRPLRLAAPALIQLIQPSTTSAPLQGFSVARELSGRWRGGVT